MYYIIEHDKKENGEINVSEVGRSSFTGALSYYYERKSKMIVNKEFVSVALMVVSEDLEIIEKDNIETQYNKDE